MYVFNDSVVFEKDVVIKGQTTIEQTNEIRPYVENGFNLTFTKENETKQVILTGSIFQPDMELLNLPEGYTQSIEINSPYKAVIDITNSDFNSTLTDLTFSNHFPEEILMQVETIIEIIRPTVTNGFSLTFYEEGETKRVTLNGEDFEDGMKLLNLPNGYTQSVEIKSSNEAVIDITSPSFNSSLASLTFANHLPESIIMQVETILNKYFDITIEFKDNYQSSSYINGSIGISTYSQNGNMYALVTGYDGDEFSVFDITDPTNIIFKDNYQNSNYISNTWDISTYSQNGNMYVAVPSRNGDEFSVFKLKAE